MECSLISDVGMVRHNNEDNFYLNGEYRKDVDEMHTELHEFIDGDRFLGAVFDGMGGEENGEIASLEAAKILSEYQSDSFQKVSSDCISEANRAVCAKMEELNSGRMGSTIAIVQIEKEQLHLCNVGDSPIFLLRDNHLEQLSVNHNEAQRLFDMGVISKDELKSNRNKHRLTQHLGIYEDEMVIEPFVLENYLLKCEDYILLCSDGLTDMVDEEDISCILQKEMDIHQKTKLLVETALENGGRDNVTVLLVKMLS
jgi:protein phosphatase